jgi:hypothetical protein
MVNAESQRAKLAKILEKLFDSGRFLGWQNAIKYCVLTIRNLYKERVMPDSAITYGAILA